jgi:Fe-S cluster assembly ATP-binding protein
MGPNGTGKSTLSSVIMGHPKYELTGGDILLDGVSIIDKPVDERARMGLFLAYQYPAEVSGVTNSDFVHAAMKANGYKGSIYKFAMQYDKMCKELKMGSNFATRYLNEGFSGGEKKRNEILQMKMIQPKFAILDEIDSGLDVDALKIVGENVNNMKSDTFASLVITHYQRLLDYIDVSHVHIMLKGKIVRSGGKELITKIDNEGYDWIKEELGIVDVEEKKVSVSLGSCALNKGNK